MTEVIETISVGKGFVKSEWILLEQSPTTALVFQPEIHDGGVRGHLVRFKKGKDNTWEEMKEQDFRSLKIGEGVRIDLRTDQVAKLYESISKFREISAKGVEHGRERYVVGKEEEVLIVTDTNIRNTILQILSKGFTEEFWKELIKTNPAEATKLSLSQIKSEREKALEEFRVDIALDKTESHWQDYFERNTWIFGFGLNYQILKQQQAQPAYGGTAVNGRGGEKGDFLMSTDGYISFTVLVEIKRPDTPMLQGTTPQRSGAWSLSQSLTDGITQLQANRSMWEMHGSRLEKNADTLEGDNVYTVSPKGILVIGHLSELDTREKRATFERFRQSLHGIEILTFDEILKRAEYFLK